MKNLLINLVRNFPENILHELLKILSLNARLKKAAELLLSGKYKVYEISEIVGYNSQSSFSRNFQKSFAMSPSEFINNGS